MSGQKDKERNRKCIHIGCDTARAAPATKTFARRHLRRQTAPARATALARALNEAARCTPWLPSAGARRPARTGPYIGTAARAAPNATKTSPDAACGVKPHLREQERSPERSTRPPRAFHDRRFPEKRPLHAWSCMAMCGQASVEIGENVADARHRVQTSAPNAGQLAGLFAPRRPPRCAPVGGLGCTGVRNAPHRSDFPAAGEHRRGKRAVPRRTERYGSKSYVEKLEETTRCKSWRAKVMLPQARPRHAVAI